MRRILDAHAGVVTAVLTTTVLTTTVLTTTVLTTAVLLATMLLATMLLATMLLATVLLATVLLATFQPPSQPTTVPVITVTVSAGAPTVRSTEPPDDRPEGISRSPTANHPHRPEQIRLSGP
jgi:hypothetical protein